MKEVNNETLVFGRKEAARRLGVSVVTIDRELAKKRIPHFRVGRSVRFTQELLEKYIEQNTCEAVPRKRRGSLNDRHN